ncbi:hypothetical protein DHODJN_00705 [Methylorubrum extorquens]
MQEQGDPTLPSSLHQANGRLHGASEIEAAREPLPHRGSCPLRRGPCQLPKARDLLRVPNPLRVVAAHVGRRLSNMARLVTLAPRLGILDATYLRFTRSFMR